MLQEIFQSKANQKESFFDWKKSFGTGYILFPFKPILLLLKNLDGKLYTRICDRGMKYINSKELIFWKFLQNISALSIFSKRMRAERFHMTENLQHISYPSIELKNSIHNRTQHFISLQDQLCKLQIRRIANPSLLCSSLPCLLSRCCLCFPIIKQTPPPTNEKMRKQCNAEIKLRFTRCTLFNYSARIQSQLLAFGINWAFARSAARLQFSFPISQWTNINAFILTASFTC